MYNKPSLSIKAIGKCLVRHPEILILLFLAAFSTSALCGEAQQTLLSAGQVQERLNSAGYSPLWQVRRSLAGYTVEGIDPGGNPVVLEVDPFSADIIAMNTLALLK